MSEYDAQISRALGTDEGWETLLEKDYGYILNKDDEEKAREECKSEIIEFIEKNEFLLAQSKEKRDDFFGLALSCCLFAVRQSATFDIRFHAEEKIMCVRVFSPVFMLFCPDILWLSNSSVFANYMEIEAMDDEQKRTRISIALTFSDKLPSLIEHARKGSPKDEEHPQE